MKKAHCKYLNLKFYLPLFSFRYDIKLNAFNTQRDLLDGIEELSYANGKATRIDKALLLASSQGFAEVNGARSGVNKVRN